MTALACRRLRAEFFSVPPQERVEWLESHKKELTS